MPTGNAIQTEKCVARGESTVCPSCHCWVDNTEIDALCDECREIVLPPVGSAIIYARDWDGALFGGLVVEYAKDHPRIAIVLAPDGRRLAVHGSNIREVL